jgi:hypothetical protein
MGAIKQVVRATLPRHCDKNIKCSAALLHDIAARHSRARHTSRLKSRMHNKGSQCYVECTLAAPSWQKPADLGPVPLTSHAGADMPLTAATTPAAW